MADTAEKTTELEKAAKPASKGVKYVCKTKCFYAGKLYNIDDVYIADAGEKVPEHFVKQ
jgi:hypothetical protein